MTKIDKDFFKENNNLNTIESFLGSDEIVLWKSIPKKMAYIFGHSLAMMPIGLIWGIFDFSILFFIFVSGTAPVQVLIIIIPFFALHLTPFWIWLYNLIKAYNETKTILYVITNKRVLIYKGVNRYIAESVYFNEITDITLKINVIDKILHVGDISIFVNDKILMISDIPNPSFIHQKLMELRYSTTDEQGDFYSDRVECPHCGTFFDGKEVRCPSCGAPIKK